MNVFFIIAGLVGIAIATYLVMLYTGRVKDEDKNFIPDSVDEKIEDAKELIDDIKETVDEVADEIADVIDEAKDVVSVIKGKVTKSKLRTLTKAKLMEAAEKDHGVKLDSKLNKTNLINKVYELYNK